MLTAKNGITLIELVVVIAIIGILASAALPLTRLNVKRTKEMELRSALRLIRTTIDDFRRDCLGGAAMAAAAAATPGALAPLTSIALGSGVKLSSEYCKPEGDYYPESLELLTQPLKLQGTVEKTKKYLRRIPRDPMMPLSSPDNTNNWGLRSESDEPDSDQWSGDSVFDVYSKSEALAIDGTKYKTW